MALAKLTAAEQATYNSLKISHESGKASAGPALAVHLNTVGQRLFDAQAAAWKAGTLKVVEEAGAAPGNG